MKLIFYLRTALVLFGFFFISRSFSQTRTLIHDLAVTDNCNGYYEYLPKGYITNPSKKFPLLLYFHGLGATGNGSLAALTYMMNELGWGTPPWRSWRGSNYLPDSFLVNGKYMEFILICPMFIEEPFSKPNKYFNDIIDYCISHYRVDESKIYLTGQSGNAMAILNYLGMSDANASRIAAAATSSPSSSGSQAYGNTIAANNVPVWIAASQYERGGDPDQYRNFAQSWYNYIVNGHPDPDYAPRLSIIPDEDPNIHNGHGDAAAYLYNPVNHEDGKNVYQWLLQYQKTLLPVTGLDIQVKNIDGRIELTWLTHTEINNKGFNVQQSSDGTNFKNIGFVAASGKSNGASYQFNVKDAENGINYFRLEQIDLDGRTSYSQIVSIRFISSRGIVVSPNPVHHLLTVNFNAEVHNATIQIFDNSGKLWKEVKEISTKEKQLDVSALPTGFYTGRFIDGKNVSTFSFIKN